MTTENKKIEGKFYAVNPEDSHKFSGIYVDGVTFRHYHRCEIPSEKEGHRKYSVQNGLLEVDIGNINNREPCIIKISSNDETEISKEIEKMQRKFLFKLEKTRR